MCRVQISIYFLCICINILIPTTRATIQNNGSLKDPKQTFHRNKTQEYELPLHPSKTELRNYLLKKLSKMTDTEIARQSEIITEKLLNHPVYKNCRKIGVYVSTSREVQTYDIIQDIFDSGRECFIPKYDKNNNMIMVKIKSMEDLKSLPKNKNNITQPADDEQREIARGLHLIIVPGIGFTKFGKRLGRGKGYFDRFLHIYDKTILTLSYMSVGLAFNEQLCEYIPMTPKDHEVDFVLYP